MRNLLLALLFVPALCGLAVAADAGFQVVFPDGQTRQVDRRALLPILRDFVQGSTDGRLLWRRHPNDRYPAWIERKGSDVTFHTSQNEEDAQAHGREAAQRTLEERWIHLLAEACLSNLKRIEVALDMWQVDHKEKYPTRLAQVVPDHLPSLPTCPSADTDTYSAGYKTTAALDAFEVTCSGAHHPEGSPCRQPYPASLASASPSPTPFPSPSPTPTPLIDPDRGRPTTAEAAKILALVQQRLASLKSYEMLIVARIGMRPDVQASTRVAWLGPRYLRLDSTFGASGPETLTVRMVFDGTWQWADATNPNGQRFVCKIRLDKTTKPSRPFDTFYYLQGAGLSQGGDYRSTINETVSLYHFQVVGTEQADGQTCTVLQGSLDDDAVWAADPRVAKAPERLRARLLEAIRRCRLWVRADGMVVRMEQGSLEDFRDGKRHMAVDYREVRLDPPLTTKDFEFHTPASIEVRDITDEVIRRRQQSER